MVLKQLILILFSILIHNQKAIGQKILFVEPQAGSNHAASKDTVFHSFNQAIEEANDYWAEGEEDIVILVKPGKYYLKEPIILSNQTLSNKKDETKLTISGNSESPPVLSGGVKIQNWISRGSNLYSAAAPELSFRQMYIDGKRATRSREPNVCNYYRLFWVLDNKNINVTKELQNFGIDDGKTEIFIQKIWSCQIFRIGKATKLAEYTKLSFISEDEEVFTARPWQIKDNLSFHLENNFQFLDSENEWYLDSNKGTVYIYKTDENSNDNLNIEVPQLENLLIIQGNEENKIQKIQITNLIFENTNWTLPDSIGLYAGQATYIYELENGQPKNSAVFMENVSDIEFSKNIIRNAGGNGLMLYQNVSHSTVNDNILTEIAANGIIVDWKLKPNLSSEKYCHSIEINNNLVTKIGRDYFGSVGIFTGYAYDISIKGNFLIDLPYTGISVGWGHTYDSTAITKNVIKYNYISNVMNLTSDGAGIYTLSNQPGTIISSNFIENIRQSKWSFGSNHAYGIYLDQGSSNIRVRNNKFDDVGNNFTTNTEGQNDIFFNSEVLLSEFIQNNKIYNNYDSLRSIIIGEIRCLNYAEKGSIFILPNPIESEFYIYFKLITSLKQPLAYNIYSLDGRKVAQGVAVFLKDNMFQSNLSSNIRNGTYIIRVINQNNYYSSKIVIDR